MFHVFQLKKNTIGMDELPPGVSFTPAPPAAVPCDADEVNEGCKVKGVCAEGSNVDEKCRESLQGRVKSQQRLPLKGKSSLKQARSSVSAVGSALTAAKTLRARSVLKRRPSSNSPIQYNYLVKPGNNSLVILNALRRRPWFGSASKSAPLGDPSINLVWEMYRYPKRCSATPASSLCALNHLDGNSSIVSKKGLYKNLLLYCQNSADAPNGSVSINDLVPPTFLVKSTSSPDFIRFCQYLESATSTEDNCFGLTFPSQPSKANQADSDVDDDEDDEPASSSSETRAVSPADDATIQDESPAVEFSQDFISPSDPPESSSLTTATMSGTCSAGSIWIVKPAASTNRGCGIQVCHGLDNVVNAISTPSKSALNNRLTRKYGFIVQKYIERPLLIYNRKFDLRVYVLFTIHKNTLETYMYNEPYVRTSSVPYSIDKKTISNKMMHLTNDAVQNKKKGFYGKFEAGNKLSFSDFGAYLSEKKKAPADFTTATLLPRLQDMVRISSLSVSHKLNNSKRKHGFEMMGYDFMLDDDLNPWFIEVNSNPCLEMPCPLLERLVAEVIESTFQIAVDRNFPPPKVQTKKCQQAIKDIEESAKNNQFTRLL